MTGSGFFTLGPPPSKLKQMEPGDVVWINGDEYLVHEENGWLVLRRTKDGSRGLAFSERGEK